MICKGGTVFNSPSYISGHFLTKVSFCTDCGYFVHLCQ